MNIAILDYGAGNLRSVARAVARAGYEATVTASPADALAADAVILPGVGAAADTMRNLTESGLVGPVREVIARGTPFLGVCMGLQALFTVSEEGGEHRCLDVIPGRVRRFSPGLKVPQIGWNTVHELRPHPVFEGIPDGSYFYFVHSYYVDPEDQSVIIGETDYGRTFPSVIARGSLVATQFHPEKSGAAGLRLYANFLRIAERALTGQAVRPGEGAG
ncbi:MAG: imidazole glycerol phosphate synthase subunit HisH [Dehalococcoidia bacterium]|nr:imidazole glycerol phosphate synthase subunit HisH [Dehalococcoidia bacterium]